MTLDQQWIQELQYEYRNRLRQMENYEPGSNDHEMLKWETNDILQLMIYIHSNHGLGYPFGSNLRKLISITPSKYVEDKAREILKVWEGIII